MAKMHHNDRFVIGLTQLPCDTELSMLTGLKGFTLWKRGSSAEIFLNDEGIGLKLYNPQIGKEAVLTEFGLLGALRNDFPCPEGLDPVYFGNRFGFRFRWIDGKPLIDALRNDKHRIVELAKRFAVLHARIHETPGPDFLPNQVEYTETFLERLTHISPSLRSWLKEEIRSIPRGGKLCHGDFHPNNVIVDSHRATAIDWLIAYSGHPVSDVARTWAKLGFWGHRSGQEAEFARFSRSYLQEYERFAELDRDLFVRSIAINAALKSHQSAPPIRSWFSKQFDLCIEEPQALRRQIFEQ